MDGTHRIVQIKGHYEAYDEYGNFVTSGDTYEECYNDLREMIIAEAIVSAQTENIRKAVAV